MITDGQAEIFILMKLLAPGRSPRHSFVGGKHTSIRNISKGKPPEDTATIKRVAHRMLKEGWFIKKPKSDDLHISLSSGMKGRAYNRLRELGAVF